MTLDEVMSALASKGSEQTQKTWLRHGAKEPIFGVKIADMKVIAKKIRGDQNLALALYDTGNGDAMYLAGIVADGRKMTRAQLDRWAKEAKWPMICGGTVAVVAHEHPEGFDVAMKWIDSPEEHVAVAGWTTLGGIVATVPDEKLPIKKLDALLDRVARALKTAANRVRYAMNSFVISCGTYVAALGDKAIATARKAGRVECDMGDTACEVPDAESYIIKCRRGAPVAKKRKTIRC